MRQSTTRKLSQPLFECSSSSSSSSTAGTGVTRSMGRVSIDGGKTSMSSGSREDLFSCLLCVESFRKPKILECQHAFCEQCLQLYYKTYKGIQYEQRGIFVPCPTCRKLTKVPSDGLVGLDHHKYDDRMVELKRKMSTIGGINIQRCDICVFKNKLEESEYYCSKCLLNLCSNCKTAHGQETLFKAHQVIHISNKETIQLSCDTHNKLQSHYFCQDCTIPLCTVCVMLEHSSHSTMKLHDALSNRRDNIKTLLNCLGPKMDKIEVKVKKLAYLYAMKSRTSGKNGISRSASEAADMASSINGITMDFKSRKFSLMEIPQNREFTEQDVKIQNFSCQIDRARKVYDLASKITEMSQSKKLLAMYEDIIWRIQAIIEVEMKQVQEEVDTLLSDEEETMNELLQQMNVGSNGSTGANHERATSLSSGGTDDSSSLDEVLFDEPQQSLLIKPKLLWKVEKQKNDPGELLNPCDICFLGDNVVVAEYDNMNDRNNRLHIFDSDGKSTSVIAQGQIRPLGVTLTREGNIAVTDCKGKRVKIYTPSGQLLSEWGKGMFGWPYGIAVNSKGQIIVSDAFNDSISIHQPDGRKIKQFGSSGANSSQFRNPYHVTCDHNDNIIVSDCGNHCFKVFDINGQYMYRSSEVRRGSSTADSFLIDGKRKRRKLRGPRGIAIDLKSNILVADDNSRVCLFDSRGKYIRNVLTDEDSVKYAEGVATNNKGLLAVTEWNPSNMFSVKVFSLYE